MPLDDMKVQFTQSLCGRQALCTPHKQTEKDWSDAVLVRLRVMDQDRSSTGLYTNRPPPPTVLSLWHLEH